MQTCKEEGVNVINFFPLVCLNSRVSLMYPYTFDARELSDRTVF